MIQYHIISFTLGFLLDLLIGDPYHLPHPVRMIGALIAWLEKQLFPGSAELIMPEGQQRRRGMLLVCIVLLVAAGTTLIVWWTAYRVHPVLGILLESILTYYTLALKCLKQESMKVYHCLVKQNIEGARIAVSMIVGRDTSVLTDVGIAKAAIETVAENSSDGVIAPLLYLAIGGPVAGMVYKAINTMDSMIGYKNERYLHFGRVAARLDDAANYLPARISAWFMIAASYFLGYNAKQAVQIYRRDRYQHASPNSAHTEAVCAGALGIQLAGDAVYFGKVVKKPFIGTATRAVAYQDIVRANALLYGSAWLCFSSCLCILYFIRGW